MFLTFCDGTVSGVTAVASFMITHLAEDRYARTRTCNIIFSSCLLSASSSNFCPPSQVTKFTFTKAPVLFFLYLSRGQMMPTSGRTRSFLAGKLVNKETDVPRVMRLHFAGDSYFCRVAGLQEEKRFLDRSSLVLHVNRW